MPHITANYLWAAALIINLGAIWTCLIALGRAWKRYKTPPCPPAPARGVAALPADTSQPLDEETTEVQLHEATDPWDGAPAVPPQWDTYVMELPPVRPGAARREPGGGRRVVRRNGSPAAADPGLWPVLSPAPAVEPVEDKQEGGRYLEFILTPIKDKK